MEKFIPFLAFPPMLRRVIYTTNAIESLNYQLRKVTKNRGHFPSDDDAVKLLWLAICNIEDKRARDRHKEKGRKKGAKRNAEGRLVEGQLTTNWKLLVWAELPDLTARSCRYCGPQTTSPPLG